MANLRLQKIRARQAVRNARRRAQLIADFSGQPHVIRLDRLNKRVRIAVYDAFRDAATDRIFWPITR